MMSWKDHARRVGLVVLALVASTACGVAPSGPARMRVDAELLPWADFSRYHSYRWWTLPLAESRRGYSEREALIDWYVRQAVNRELAARGFAQDVAGKPDFVVSYDVSLTEDATSSFTDYLQYRAEGGGKDMGEALMGYERGALTIKITDVATRRTAWRGTASAVVESDQRGKRIDPAVRAIFERFPVPVR